MTTYRRPSEGVGKTLNKWQDNFGRQSKPLRYGYTTHPCRFGYVRNDRTRRDDGTELIG